MFENGDINNDNDAQNGNEELEIINVNNIKEKEKEKDFPLETDEIEVFSPESLQNLLVNDDTKEAENESIKKKESVNNIDESNNKDIEKVENKTKNRKGEILNFEDLMERNRKKNDNNNKKKINKKRTNFSGRLYQPKKSYNVTENNNGIDYEFNEFLNNKKKSRAKSAKREINNPKKIRADNKEIIRNFLMRNIPKKDDTRRKQIENERIKKNIMIKRIPKNINKLSKSPKRNILTNFDKLNYRKPTCSYENKRKKLPKYNSESIFKNNKLSKNEKKNYIPYNAIETKKIDLALKNKIKEIKVPRRHDSSKYEKFDTEQMRYRLIKEYSNIKPNKENGFLGRMTFYSLKERIRQENINELCEKNKYKINELERKMAFNRLIEDANRRITERNKIENEKMNEDISYITNINSKKYSDEEWNIIYNERFKKYDEYKKKKLEIEREKEKIEKMIKEEQSNINNINIISLNNIYRNENDENELNNSNGIKNNDINNLNEFKSYQSSKIYIYKNELNNKLPMKFKYRSRSPNNNYYKIKNMNLNEKKIKEYEEFKKNKRKNNSNANVQKSPLEFINNYDYKEKKELNFEKENIVDNYLYNYCLNSFNISNNLINFNI